MVQWKMAHLPRSSGPRSGRLVHFLGGQCLPEIRFDNSDPRRPRLWDFAFFSEFVDEIPVVLHGKIVLEDVMVLQEVTVGKHKVAHTTRYLVCSRHALVHLS